MPNNVIEIIVKATDQVTGPLKAIKSKLGGVGAFLGLVGFAATFRAVIKATEEAQEATAQLNAAYKATGSTVGITREHMDELADSLQRTTIYEDDLVKSAESILLTFNKVRGEAFERTIRAAADLSARFGGDLTTAVRGLGAALQDPIQGMSRLRRQGIQFTDAQKELVKGFIEAGNAAAAQNVILSEVEKRFKGSAEAARQTLGGALEGLSNAFHDMLEASEEGTSGAVGAINELTDTLSDPATKKAVQDMVALMFSLFTIVGETAGFIGKLVDEFQLLTHTGGDDLNDLLNDLERDRKNMLVFERAGNEAVVKELQDRIAKNTALLVKIQHGGLTDPLAGRGRVFKFDASDNVKETVQSLVKQFEGVESSLEKQIALFGDTSKAAEIAYETTKGELASLYPEDKKRLLQLAQQFDQLNKNKTLIQDMQEVIITAKKMNEDWAKSIALTGTAAEKAGLEYIAFMADLQQQTERGLSPQKFNERREDFFKEHGLVEFKHEDLAQKMVLPFQKAVGDMTEFGIQAARNIETSFAQFLFDPFKDGLDGMLKGFVDIIRQMLAEAASAQILEALFPKSSGGLGGFLGGLFGGGGGFDAAAFESSSSSFFAGLGGGEILIPHASGGPVSAGQSYLVGEKGPEKFTPAMSGFITPNSHLGGSDSPINVTYNIDNRGATKDAMESLPAILAENNARLLAHIEDRQSRGRGRRG